jgi:hypothetical protein
VTASATTATLAGTAALQDRIAALEAERLTPVPRASHAVGVDIGDLALVLHYVRASLRASRIGGPGARRAADLMSGDTIAAYQRLEAAVAGHVVAGSTR